MRAGVRSMVRGRLREKWGRRKTESESNEKQSRRAIKRGR